MKELYILAPIWAVEKFGISINGKRKIRNACMLWRKDFPNEQGKYIYQLASLVKGVPMSEKELENIINGKSPLPEFEKEPKSEINDEESNTMDEEPLHKNQESI